MEERNADCHLDAVDEEFRNTVEFLIDLISGDAWDFNIHH